MREGTVTICSIFPMESIARRDLFQPTNIFHLPAAEKGKVTTLRVRDQVQPENVGHGRHFPIQIVAEEVAQDIVRIWVTGRLFPGIPDGAQPGIWIPENWQTPTDEETARMERAQDLYANAVIDQADRYERNNDIDSINETHHVMAEYRGITGRKWQTGSLRRDTSTCPFCDTSVPKRIAKCPNCKEIIDAPLYEALIRARQSGEAGTVQEAPKAEAPEPTEDAFDFDMDIDDLQPVK